jgi:response regulator RpfG family c-di-GMP phosphodiesterase
VGTADELEPDQGALRSPTVLVVEDEPLIRMLLADILRDANLAVVEAISGDWKPARTTIPKPSDKFSKTILPATRSSVRIVGSTSRSTTSNKKTPVR